MSTRTPAKTAERMSMVLAALLYLEFNINAVASGWRLGNFLEYQWIFFILGVPIVLICWFLNRWRS